MPSFVHYHLHNIGVILNVFLNSLLHWRWPDNTLIDKVFKEHHWMLALNKPGNVLHHKLYWLSIIKLYDTQRADWIMARHTMSKVKASVITFHITRANQTYERLLIFNNIHRNRWMADLAMYLIPDNPSILPDRLFDYWISFKFEMFLFFNVWHSWIKIGDLAGTLVYHTKLTSL